MENVEVRKEELITVIKKNRDKHQAIFEEALEGYKKKSIAILEKTLKDAREGTHIDEVISIRRPVNQLADYDRVLKMLEMCVDDTVVLEEQEFAQYVMDDWHWKRQFLMSNSIYSTTATKALSDND